MNRQVPEALLDALGDLVAEQRREWARDHERAIDRIQTESRSLIAELRAEIAEIKASHEMLKVGNQMQLVDVKGQVNTEIERVRAAMTLVKDGRDGKDGEKGDKGERGEKGKDADPELVGVMVDEVVAERVSKAFAALPIAEKGDPGKPGLGIVKIFYDLCQDGLYAQYTDGTLQHIANNIRGEKGDPGESADPEVVADIVLKKIPVPKDGEPGRDGKDADMEVVKTWIDQRFAAIPVPRDGRDGKDGRDGLDGKDGLPGERGEKGEPGADGKDAEVDYQRLQDNLEKVMLPEIKDEVAKQIAAIPVPRDGIDGKDGIDGLNGKDADPDEVRRIVVESVHAAVESEIKALPPAPKGDKGERGDPGKDAEVDYQLLLNELLPFAKTEVEEQLAKAVAALPPPQPGPQGVPGLKGEKGDPGEPGKDGANIVGGFKSHDGRAILTLSNGSIIDLGTVQGRDGRDGIDGKDGTPGHDGKDGITFDDFEWKFEYDGARQGKVKVVSKGKTLEWPVSLPAILYRGIYKPDVQYQTGDSVSYGGSLWIAKTDTSEKPEESGSDWQLACKRGRDGRDGKEGAKGQKGDPGSPGRDLTHLK